MIMIMMKWTFKVFSIAPHLTDMGMFSSCSYFNVQCMHSDMTYYYYCSILTILPLRTDVPLFSP